MSKQAVAIGIAAGAAVAILVPVSLLLATSAGRSALLRAMERGSRALSGKATETLAELQEIAEDLIAEVRVSSAATGALGTAAASTSTPAEPLASEAVGAAQR